MEPDLHELLSAWLGEDLDAVRREALLTRLRADEAFRRAFVAEIRMLGMLKAVQAAEPRWLGLEDEMGWSVEVRATGEEIDEGVVRGIDDPPRRRSGRRWWFAAAALLIGIVLTVPTWPRGRREPPASDRPSPGVDVANGLAIVVKLDGVRWEPTDSLHPSEGDVLAAGRLRLRSGRATLSMLSGVVIVVEGPADLELASIDKVFCHRGKLRARVPEGAEGFVVNGPGSAVVDLGTEFGLNIEAEGKARGKVFKGEVEAAVLNAAGTLRHSRIIRKDGSAFEIDPRTGLIDANAQLEDFVTPSEIAAPPLTLTASYPDAVVGARPWGYWRFESMSGNAIPNEVPGRPELRANGPIRLDGPSPGGRCAVFRSGERGQYLSLDGHWEPTRATGFALELWFLSEAIGHATLASLVAPRDTRNHTFLLELTSRNRFVLHRPASVRVLQRWPSGPAGGDNLFSEGCYVPYRWHHVVSQLSRDRIELYLDGAITSSLPLRIGDETVPCQFLLGELTTLAIPNTGASRPFAGRMDEVALYDHPLSAEEIRLHHRLAVPSRSSD